MGGYFSEVFRGRPCGRKVDKISETDAIWPATLVSQSHVRSGMLWLSSTR